jgi:hypothetical protein
LLELLLVLLLVKFLQLVFQKNLVINVVKEMKLFIPIMMVIGVLKIMNGVVFHPVMMDAGLLH